MKYLIYAMNAAFLSSTLCIGSLYADNYRTNLQVSATVIRSCVIDNSLTNTTSDTYTQILCSQNSAPVVHYQTIPITNDPLSSTQETSGFLTLTVIDF